MSAKNIAEVLYAPHKVFKKIVQNPSYLVPILMLILFVLAQIAGSYFVNSKLYTEKTAPPGLEADVWTENATLWQANSGVVISENTVDFINGSQTSFAFPDYYGNSSIEFAISDNTTLQMTLSDFGHQVNCGANGSRDVYFRVKIVTPDTNPEKVSLTLYSLTDEDFFYYDLTGEFATSTVNVWNNITAPVGSVDWLSNGNPSWENITGLKLEFVWTSNSDIDLRLDGLFFRNSFINEIERMGGIFQFIGSAAFNAFAPFLLEWLLLTVFIYLLIKWLKGNVVWRPLFVAVGCALITIVIKNVIVVAINTALFPLIYIPLEGLAYIPGEFEVVAEVLANQLATFYLVNNVLRAIIWVWIILLGTFIVRAITSDAKIAEQLGMGATASDANSRGDVVELSWMKCVLVSGVSLLITIILLDLLFGIIA